MGETSAADGERPDGAEGPDTEREQPNALGGDVATRSSTAPTPKDERVGGRSTLFVTPGSFRGPASSRDGS